MNFAVSAVVGESRQVPSQKLREPLNDSRFDRLAEEEKAPSIKRTVVADLRRLG